MAAPGSDAARIHGRRPRCARSPRVLHHPAEAIDGAQLDVVVGGAAFGRDPVGSTAGTSGEPELGAQPSQQTAPLTRTFAFSRAIVRPRDLTNRVVRWSSAGPGLD